MIKYLLFHIISLLTIAFPMHGQSMDTLNTDLKHWVRESESDSSIIQNINNEIEITAPKGLTLWLNKKIKGDCKIVFYAFVVKENGRFDRVSDLNCFWMARDPQYPEDIFKRSEWRKGTFGKYYSLHTYYVGYGGNNNTTTRFRKYNGDYQSFIDKTQRPDIIQEYSDTANLIVPNKWNKIEIINTKNRIQYYFNNKLLFDYNDPAPLTEGYFGIRTVTSHMKIKLVQIFYL